MSPKDVKKLYPCHAELGRQLGVTGACISMWHTRGTVPVMAQLRLNQMTNGKLRLSQKAMAIVRDMGLAGVVK